jgi:valyl-tRNA synthetase
VQPLEKIEVSRLRRADRWILAALNKAIEECDAALGPARPENGVWDSSEIRAGLRLSEYTESARRFVWNELADWYLESTKGRLSSADDDSDVARAVLAHAFDAALRLLQPVVPFITDVLWRRLPVATRDRGDFIARAAWPLRDERFKSEPEFDLVREAVNSVRQLRADYAIPPGDRITASLDVSAAGANADRDSGIFSDEAEFIARIARCNVVESNGRESGASILLSSGSRLNVPLAGVIDIEKECRKARTELEKLDGQLSALAARLVNPGFIDRAPQHVVEAERAKHSEWTSRRAQLSEKVTSLCGS